MTRFGWMENDLDDDWMLQHGRWVARTNKVLKGKPGREALQELERVLLAMPHKRLIQGSLVQTCGDSEVFRRQCGVCVVGAWIYRRKVDEGMTPRAAWKSLKSIERPEGWRPAWDEDGYEEYDRTKRAAVAELGITETLAQMVSYDNDEGLYWQQSPEDRYKYVLGWVRRALAGQVHYG